MLGELLGQVSGKLLGTRVLPTEGQLVKVEVSFQGSGTFLGEDITDMNERQLAHVRRKAQLVFQSGALFDSLTVWENVAFPLSDTGQTDEEIEEKVQEYLERQELYWEQVKREIDRIPSPVVDRLRALRLSKASERR